MRSVPLALQIPSAIERDVKATISRFGCSPTRVIIRVSVLNQSKVLEVCLEEIDRCRPFFIGILGQPYWRSISGLCSGLSQISGNQLQLNRSITSSISLDLNSDNTIVQIHDDHSACTPTG